MAVDKTEIYENLRFRIITNELRPGEMLNEKDLMNQYKIGRTPLREIFLQLQRDRLIQMIPRLGTLIAPLDIQEIKEIIEIRKEMEGLVGQLAAERITENQLDALRQIIKNVQDLEAEEVEDVKAWSQYDYDFHNIIYEAAQNRKLKEVLNELHNIIARFWFHLGFNWKEYASGFDDLRMMLDALEKRDTLRARETLANHVGHFVNKAKKYIL